MTWEQFVAILQMVQTVAVIIALVYGWQQIQEAKKEVNLGAVWQIFNELSSDEINDARRYVYKHRAEIAQLDNGKEIEELPLELRRTAAKVGNNLNRLGYAIHKGLISKELLLDGYAYIIARTWVCLEPFVRKQRILRNEKTYQQYFELLATYALNGYVKREDIKIF